MSDGREISTRQFVQDVLLVVAKRPAAGGTKTRLCPPLSPEQAAELYECFLRDTLDLIRSVPQVQPAIAYLPIEAEPYFLALAPDFETLFQQGDNLGERLDYCLSSYLQRGYRRAVIMSSDVPNIPGSFLNQAFQGLEQADVVLGPCDDGGYYLIGLKRPAPRLLREVRMSTDHVTRDTLALAQEEALQVHLLPTWYDVDDAETLARLRADLDCQPSSIAAYTRRGLERLNVRSGD
jgi:rSAM/selenodomain-associated transferase 1